MEFTENTLKKMKDAVRSVQEKTEGKEAELRRASSASSTDSRASDATGMALSFSPPRTVCSPIGWRKRRGLPQDRLSGALQGRFCWATLWGTGWT